MAKWVEKGSIKGPPGEIPDVSDFLRDGDVSSAISGSAEKVASDKAVKDYVDAQVSAEATSRQEQDSSLQTQIGGKANVEHSHEMDDVTGLNDKISEIETSVSGKANASHTHTIENVTGLQDALDEKADVGSMTLTSLGVTATSEELNYMDGVTSNVQTQLDGKANVEHDHEIVDVTGLQDALDSKASLAHTHSTSDVTGLDSKISEIEGDVAGKADSVHTHDAADVVSGTLVVDRIPSIPDSKIESVSASKLVGTIPTGNLPSYVDDVIEADDYDALPPTGEAGKIYVDKETNKTYRWGGSAYVEISASLALGETSATAFRGDHGKTAYDHAQAKGSEFATGLYKIATNAEGHVISATAVAKGDITALGVPAQDTTYVDATTSDSGLMSAADKTKLNGIEDGANNYTHPTSAAGAKAFGLYKVETDANGHVIGAVNVVKSDITSLGIPAQDTTYVDATGSASGLMSASDKSKLDGIAEGADKLPDGGTEGQVLTKTTSGSEWQDAPDGLPSGGSQRDVLAKTASGEEWSGGYPWVSDMESGDWTLRGYFADGERNIPQLKIASNGGGNSTISLNSVSGISVSSSSTGTIEVKSAAFSEYVRLTAASDDYAEIATNGKLTIDSKSVTSITDDASTGNTNALATAKAVKDYVDDHGMPSVVPISKGGTGVTSEDALVQKIFNSASTPKASATKYGVVKFASDADFKAYMGIS